MVVRRPTLMHSADTRSDRPSAVDLLTSWLESHVLREPSIQSGVGDQRFPVLPQKTGSPTPGLVVRDGWAELPDRPGLGIELNADVIAAHPYEPGGYEPAYSADGAVADI